jgi:hypothetical protein
MRAVESGFGMATPTRTLQITHEGRLETLRPGRDLIHPDHSIVRANPAAFRAKAAGDIRTRSLLVRMAERKRHAPSRKLTRAPRGGKPSWALDGDGPRPPRRGSVLDVGGPSWTNPLIVDPRRGS